MFNNFTVSEFNKLNITLSEFKDFFQSLKAQGATYEGFGKFNNLKLFVSDFKELFQSLKKKVQHTNVAVSSTI